jgi:hypothetical protein
LFQLWNWKFILVINGQEKSCPVGSWMDGWMDVKGNLKDCLHISKILWKVTKIILKFSCKSKWKPLHFTFQKFIEFCNNNKLNVQCGKQQKPKLSKISKVHFWSKDTFLCLVSSKEKFSWSFFCFGDLEMDKKTLAARKCLLRTKRD